MAWWIWLLLGGLGGGGIATGLHLRLNKKPDVAPVVVVQQEEAIKSTLEVSKKLTDLDLLKPICTPEFIKENKDGSLLCRELFCLMSTRGIDSKTSAQQCDSIGNLLNKRSLYALCVEASSKKKENAS